MAAAADRIAPVTVGTVDKALGLLSHFTVAEPEHGLSELGRQAGLDKATALRILNALARNGFVEQHPETRRYRLGTGILQLAQVRETSFPVVAFVRPVLHRLAAELAETAHASVAGQHAMLTIAAAEPSRPARVWIDPSQPLPFHATASGLAYLAFAEPGVVDEALTPPRLSQHANMTPCSPSEIRDRIAVTRSAGFAVAERSFEDEVTGVAAPIFDARGRALGALAVASLAARMTHEARTTISRRVVEGALEITAAIGGIPHASLLRAREEMRRADAPPAIAPAASVRPDRRSEP